MNLPAANACDDVVNGGAGGDKAPQRGVQEAAVAGTRIEQCPSGVWPIEAREQPVDDRMRRVESGRIMQGFDGRCAIVGKEVENGHAGCSSAGIHSPVSKEAVTSCAPLARALGNPEVSDALVPCHVEPSCITSA